MPIEGATKFGATLLEEQGMSAFVIFDVDIWDPKRYQEFMAKAKPAIDAAGGRYLARGGKHKVLEGDWEPRRLVLFEFPSVAKAEEFYNSDLYQGYKAIRDECSSGNVVVVEGYQEESPGH